MAIDVHSETWKYIDEWAKTREVKLLGQLAAPTCPRKLANLIRGELIGIRALRDLPRLHAAKSALTHNIDDKEYWA